MVRRFRNHRRSGPSDRRGARSLLSERDCRTRESNLRNSRALAVGAAASATATTVGDHFVRDLRCALHLSRRVALVTAKSTLRALTLNLWGEQPPLDRRMALAIEGIRALDPDVIALQEVR